MARRERGHLAAAEDDEDRAQQYEGQGEVAQSGHPFAEEDDGEQKDEHRRGGDQQRDVGHGREEDRPVVGEQVEAGDDAGDQEQAPVTRRDVPQPNPGAGEHQSAGQHGGGRHPQHQGRGGVDVAEAHEDDGGPDSDHTDAERGVAEHPLPGVHLGGRRRHDAHGFPLGSSLRKLVAQWMPPRCRWCSLKGTVTVSKPSPSSVRRMLEAVESGSTTADEPGRKRALPMNPSRSSGSRGTIRRSRDRRVSRSVLCWLPFPPGSRSMSTVWQLTISTASRRSHAASATDGPSASQWSRWNWSGRRNRSWRRTTWSNRRRRGSRRSAAAAEVVRKPALTTATDP